VFAVDGPRGRAGGAGGGGESGSGARHRGRALVVCRRSGLRIRKGMLFARAWDRSCELRCFLAWLAGRARTQLGLGSHPERLPRPSTPRPRLRCGKTGAAMSSVGSGTARGALVPPPWMEHGRDERDERADKKRGKVGSVRCEGGMVSRAMSVRRRSRPRWSDLRRDEISPSLSGHRRS